MSRVLCSLGPVAAAFLAQHKPHQRGAWDTPVLGKELGDVAPSIHFSASVTEQPSFPTRATLILKSQSSVKGWGWCLRVLPEPPLSHWGEADVRAQELKEQGRSRKGQRGHLAQTSPASHLSGVFWSIFCISLQTFCYFTRPLPQGCNCVFLHTFHGGGYLWHSTRGTGGVLTSHLRGSIISSSYFQGHIYSLMINQVIPGTCPDISSHRQLLDHIGAKRPLISANKFCVCGYG